VLPELFPYCRERGKWNCWKEKSGVGLNAPLECMIRYEKGDFPQKVRMNQTTLRPTNEDSNLELNIDSEVVKITKQIYVETKCVFSLVKY
jgi:hypothetical protein